MAKLRFDDRVALVTGAGNGLGRSHALLLASRGAKVVVNDLGGTHTGEGKGSAAADAVVEEIKAAGGEAVANYDSVESGDKLVQTALDTWGRIDIVVNNAGILRDVSFGKMTDDDWDLVYRVHVRGSYSVTKAAWPQMREKQFGRVVMTSSAAGIYGNFGQANYSMAKLGLAGFANTLSIEGSRRNIHVNTIAPIAASRMTESILPKNLLDALQPEYVSPLVAYLCHESCEETGGLFEVGGGYYGKLRWQRTAGQLYRIGRDVTIEDIRKSWSVITRFDQNAEYPSDVATAMTPVVENVAAGPSHGGNEFIDVDLALGYEFPITTTSYDERDLSLYALGVGAAADPLDDTELQLVYEMHGKGFRALPTYGVVPAVSAIIDAAREGQQAPGLNYGLDRVLHGEQYTEVRRPLPRSARLTHRAKIKDIFDKGKHALVVTETKSYDESGELLIINELTTVVRGGGGWGGERGPARESVIPEREADAVVEQRVNPNQALLYRLSGDWNPLHADPNMARAFGFEQPILHGLCSFGHVARHAINTFFPDRDPRLFKSIKVRFAKPVVPGQTLVTELWKDGETRVLLQCKVKETDEIVISDGIVERYEEIPKPAPPPRDEAAESAAAAAGADAVADIDPSSYGSGDVFIGIADHVERHGELKDIATVFQFKLAEPDSVWTIDLKEGEVAEGETAKPECTLELSDADFMAMVRGDADPQQLYFGSKLKISGNIMASQKLTFLQQIDPEAAKQAVIAARKAQGGGSGAAGGAGAAAVADVDPSSYGSGDVFIGIADHVERHGELKDIATVFQFKLTEPDSVWTIDLKEGKVAEGELAKPECTLELSDADFMAMVRGDADPQQLYFGGKLKISGNIMASQKLTFLQQIDPEAAKQAVIAARKAQGGGGSSGASASKSAASAPAKKAAPRVSQASELHDEAKKRVASVSSDESGFVQFLLQDPEGAFALEFGAGAGQPAGMQTVKASATVAAEEDDLKALLTGELSAAQAFQRGKVRVDGDVSLARAVLESLCQTSK